MECFFSGFFFSPPRTWKEDDSKIYFTISLFFLPQTPTLASYGCLIFSSLAFSLKFPTLFILEKALLSYGEGLKNCKINSKLVGKSIFYIALLERLYHFFQQYFNFYEFLIFVSQTLSHKDS